MIWWLLSQEHSPLCALGSPSELTGVWLVLCIRRGFPARVQWVAHKCSKSLERELLRVSEGFTPG